MMAAMRDIMDPDTRREIAGLLTACAVGLMFWSVLITAVCVWRGL